MRLRHWQSSLALVLLLALGAGCSGEGGGESATSTNPTESTDSNSPPVSVVGQPNVDSSAPTVNVGSDSSPSQLRPYGPDGDRLVWNVREELTRRCMADAGFEYLTNPLPESPTPDPIPRLSLETAQTDGYRQLLSATENPELRVSPDAGLPGYADALDPSDDSQPGCFERAYQEMFADDYGQTAVDMFRALDGLDITSVVESTPEFGDLVTDWSTCMASAGFTYANPGEAVFQFVGPAAGPLDTPPSPKEIRVAVADALCRETVDFEDRYADLYSAQYETWRTDHEGALQEISRQAEGDLEEVRAVADRLGVSD